LLLGFDNLWYGRIAINKISVQLLVILDLFKVIRKFLEIVNLIVFILIEHTITDKTYYFLQFFRLSIRLQISFTPEIFHFI
jgi:hypothetical protein